MRYNVIRFYVAWDGSRNVLHCLAAYGPRTVIPVEVVTTSTKTLHLVFLVFSSAEAIDSI